MYTYYMQVVSYVTQQDLLIESDIIELFTAVPLPNSAGTMVLRSPTFLVGRGLMKQTWLAG